MTYLTCIMTYLTYALQFMTYLTCIMTYLTYAYYDILDLYYDILDLRILCWQEKALLQGSVVDPNTLNLDPDTIKFEI